MALDTVTVHSITGRQTTAGAAEETVLLTLDGAAPAAAISVPTGTVYTISDWGVCAAAAAEWRLQQANDGVTFFDIGLAKVPGVAVTPTALYSVRTGWVIQGGPLVAFRVRVTTPGGPATVTTTIRGYTES